MDLLRSTTSNHNIKKRKKKHQSPQKDEKKHSEISKTTSKRGFWNADIHEDTKCRKVKTFVVPQKHKNCSAKVIEWIINQVGVRLFV